MFSHLLSLTILVGFFSFLPAWNFAEGPVKLLADIGPNESSRKPFKPDFFGTAGNHVIFESEETYGMIWSFSPYLDRTESLYLFIPEAYGVGNIGPELLMETNDLITRNPINLLTDGTMEGTREVDFIPTGVDLDWGRPLGDLLIAPGTDSENGSELWRTDGTAEGTFILTDGQAGGDYEFATDANEIYVVGELVLFPVRDDIGDFELWKSDGTQEGTGPVYTDSAPPYSKFSLKKAAVAGDRLIFEGSAFNLSLSMWSTDGTPEETRELIRLSTEPGPIVVKRVLGAGDRVIFHTEVNSEPANLFSTDGTTGGTEIIGFNKGVQAVARVGGRTLIRTSPDQGFRLTDGTAAGTTSLPGQDGVVGGSFLASLEDFALFTAPGGLWKTDGTADGTSIIYQTDSIFDSWRHQIVDDRLIARIGEDGPTIVTDGTERGTFEATSPFDSLEYGIGVTHHHVLDDGRIGFTISTKSEPTKRILWMTDGTSEGTFPFEIPDAPAFQSYFQMVLLGQARNRLIVRQYRLHERPREVSHWSYALDGTDPQPLDVPEWYASTSQAASHGGRLFYAVVDKENGTPEIWKTDGTEQGTERVWSDNRSGTRILNFRQFGGHVYFHVSDRPDISELYFLDLESGETTYLNALYPEAGGVHELNGRILVENQSFNVYPNNVYTFTRQEPMPVPLREGLTGGSLSISGGMGFLILGADGTARLYQTDGTPAGTFPVLPASATETLQFLNSWPLFGGRLLFLAREREPEPTFWGYWIFDSATGEMNKLVDLRKENVYFHSPGTSQIVPSEDKVLINGLAKKTGVELYQLDISSAQIRFVQDIQPGARFSDPEYLVTVEDKSYFTAFRDDVGRELFVIDWNPAPASGWVLE